MATSPRREAYEEQDQFFTIAQRRAPKNFVEASSPRLQSINIYGRATDVQTTVTDIHDQANATDAVYTLPVPQIPQTHTLVSDSANDIILGTGANSLVVEGLREFSDAGYTSAVFIMLGTTPIAMGSWAFINRMSVFAMPGVLAPNVGTITATADTDGTITAQINPSVGATNTAAFAIPDTMRMYLFSFYASIMQQNVGTGASVDLRFRLNPYPVLNPTPAFLTYSAFGISTIGQNPATLRFQNPIRVRGPAILKLDATADKTGLDVTAGFEILVEKYESPQLFDF